MSTLSSMAFAPLIQAGGTLISDQLADVTGVGSAGYRRDVQIRQNKAQPNVLAPIDAMIALYWQSEWIGGRPQVELQRLLDRTLAQHGVEFSNGVWRNVVDQGGNRAPLGDYLRGFYRRIKDSAGNALFTGEGPREEITKRLRREMLQRPVDVELTMRPPFAWSAADALRLLWFGAVSYDQYRQIVSAAGAARVDDASYTRVLAQYLPSPEDLQSWAQRSLFDAALAERYRLDAAYESSPVAVFFSKAQGKGADDILPPNAPDGNKNWLQLSMRAGVPLPGFREATEMQHRLRPSGAGDGSSVVPGSPAWGASNTRDMLALAGFTTPIIDRLMGLTTEPINVRIVNQVLHEILTHPNVAADVAATFPEGTDWVKATYLDYGYSDGVAQAAADAARAKADDAYHAERDEEIKRQRANARKLTLDEYTAGLRSDVDAGLALVNEQFTQPMAQEAIEQVNREFKLSLLAAQVAAIQEAWLQGKLTIDQVGVQLKNAGVNDTRIILYVQEFVWLRTEKIKTLETGEILKALKSGLMTSAIALQRLTNLGWTAPDAAVEIALAETEVAAANAKQETAAAAKQISSTLRTQREAAAAQKTAASEQAKAAKAAKKASDLAAGLPLEAETAAQEYGASALLDLDAYNKAVGKGDTNKAQAEIDKAIAAYGKLLTKQLSLKEGSPDEAGEVKPVGAIAIPGAPASAGAGSNATNASPQPGATPAAGSGGAAPPAG